MAHSNATIVGFNNGKFVTLSDITIPVDNIGVNRGYGAFDFFGVINNKPFYLERHLDRFFNSLTMLRLKISYSREQVKELVEEVVRLNSATNFHIKLFALPLSTDATPSLDCGFYIVPVDASPFCNDVYLNGGTLITKEYMRFAPEAKSTNYLPLIYWYGEIAAAGAIDVLYHSNGTIKETSRGNIFIVKNNSAYTPESEVLKGITRSVVIDILKNNGVAITEKSVSLNELFSADEVFLTSTTKKVLPIVKIDEKVIGNGKVGALTLSLIKVFDNLQISYR
jgi:branched-subunit amino acid aminotransferase/4-amino-4-deoxychorismate lyase